MSDSENTPRVTLEDQIRNKLKENKPNLTPSSIKAYVSTLKNLYKKVYPRDEFDIRKFNNQKKFLDYLKNTPINKRKTILASLINICDSDKCEDYRKVMVEDATIYSNEQRMQKKTEKQEASWVEEEELKNIMDNLEFEFNEIMKIKTPTMEQLQRAQSFIILALTSGKYIPPRRSVDWCFMKWRNISDENMDEENYMDKKNFVFNKYKTKKYYNQTSIPIPNSLKKILSKWTSKINNDYLLFDNTNKPLTAVTMNQRLNKIFGKKTAINTLRHMFITNKYKNLPALNDMLKSAEEMGHSLETHLEYIKK